MTDQYVREDIWALEQQQTWHPVARAYALAVDVLRQRPQDDPTGWDYQAAVHGTRVRPDRWRNQCQHFSWFFLPWHRLYLYWFERIVRDVVRALDEVDDETRETWALPYWDYGRDRLTRRLPPAFRARTLPDGRPNPLRVEQRHPAMNRGALLRPEVVSARASLQTTQFSARPAVGRPAGFGGPVTGWHHAAESGFSISGALENTPHGAVHTGVGGPGGLMSGFGTAPLDPVFWLHHANVDRLWEVWLAQPGRRNPAVPSWLDQQFDFHDEQGTPVRGRVGDVVDTSALGYTYAAVPAPTPAPTPTPTPTPPPAGAVPPEGAEEERAMTPEQEGEPPTELVGATGRAVVLGGQRRRVRFGLSAPEGPLSGARSGVPEHVYLNVEDVRAQENPGLSYAVYLDVPDDDEATDDRHHVGNVHLFGVEETSEPPGDARHSGLRFAFDITDLYTALRDSDRWRDEVSVTFEPLQPELPDESEEEYEDAGGTGDEAGPPRAGIEPPEVPVTVGRVSVFYS